MTLSERMHQLEQMQNAFRFWGEKQGYHFELSTIPGRTYSSDATEHAWRGWSNAWSLIN